MTNPSIHSGAPAAHGITRPFLLLLLLLLSAAAPPSATAQMNNASSSSSGPNISNSNNGNSIMVILIIVIILAFLVMGFLSSVYIRACAESENSRRAAAAASAAAARRRLKRGLEPEVIQSFPIFLYSDVKDLKIGKGGELECAVCIAEFENDDTLRLLPKCDHVFHPECIDAWLASHSTCPLCRADLTPSQDELRKVTESTQTSDPDGAQNPNQSLSQDHDQDETLIPIDVEEGGNSEVQVSEMPKRKLPRSHTTGHSLSQPGGDLERYTLRLPIQVKREMMNQSLKRTISCGVALPRERSSRRGGVEGSSRGRSDRNERSDWPFFSMAPPFFSRGRFVTSPRAGFEGELTPKSFLTNASTPFDCHPAKSDGVGQTSTRPATGLI
ncbi:hypothetical protein Vadar_005262 [Vaccinium darrowii]|uniref:Uncharacterized protein n=1 Tax=Vaccinium darrowii TaxID=229202 RepID=A0ACB7Z210_9ERIC|nr:hypothetical protein Vadar_005262 [Vaccinium darrowii]